MDDDLTEQDTQPLDDILSENDNVGESLGKSGTKGKI